MQCIRPLKAYQRPDLSISFSARESIPGLEPIPLPCRKCLPCRLNTGREKAIRAYHESQSHEDNIFLTLTYNEESLLSPKLIYKDFQDFMKRLRLLTSNKISYMVTGEYGDKNKRPHWHAIIFNFRPYDTTYSYTSESGEKVFTSELINDCWGMGKTEFGSVTLDSASYVARYAAKKLAHGKDQDHDFHPIHKTSSKRAIGRSWIEQYYKHTFENGFIYLPNGQKASIPRYYTDWCKKHDPDLYYYYITSVRPKIIEQSLIKIKQEETDYINELQSQRLNTPSDKGVLLPMKKKNVKETILKQKFKKLQEYLKL